MSNLLKLLKAAYEFLEGEAGGGGFNMTGGNFMLHHLSWQRAAT